MCSSRVLHFFECLKSGPKPVLHLSEEYGDCFDSSLAFGLKHHIVSLTNGFVTLLNYVIICLLILIYQNSLMFVNTVVTESTQNTALQLPLATSE